MNKSNNDVNPLMSPVSPRLTKSENHFRSNPIIDYLLVNSNASNNSIESFSSIVAERGISYILTDPISGKIVIPKKIQRVKLQLLITLSNENLITINDFFTLTTNYGKAALKTESEFVFASGDSNIPFWVLDFASNLTDWKHEESQDIWFKDGSGDLPQWFNPSGLYASALVIPLVPLTFIDALAVSLIGSGGAYEMSKSFIDLEPKPTEPSQPDPIRTLEVGVFAGPVLSVNGLKITLFDNLGNVLVAEQAFVAKANGKMTIVLSSNYAGLILVKITDTNAQTDYVDEQSKAPLDLAIDLRAAFEFKSTERTLDITVSPLSEEATRKILNDRGGDAGTSSSVLGNVSKQAIVDINISTAAKYGLIGSAEKQAVVTTVDTEGNLQEANAAGVVLAVISGLGGQSKGVDAALTELSKPPSSPETFTQLLIEGALASGTHVFEALKKNNTSVASLVNLDFVAALNPNAVSNLSSEIVANLSNSQISSFTPSQAAKITVSQVDALSASQVASLSPVAVSSINTVVLQSLSTVQVNALKPEQSAQLTTAQVGALTVVQIESLAPNSLAGLSSPALQSLDASKLVALTPAQLDALSPTQLSQLSAVALAALTPAQTASLPVSVLAQLSPAQVAAIAPDLSAVQQQAVADIVAAASITSVAAAALTGVQVDALT